MLLVFNNHRPNHDIPDPLAKQDLVDVVQPFAASRCCFYDTGKTFEFLAYCHTEKVLSF